MSTRTSCSLWPLGWHNGSRATQVQTQLGSNTSTQLTKTQLPYKQACSTTDIYVWEDWTLKDTSAYKAFFHCRFRPDKVVLGILTWQHGMAFGQCGQLFQSQSESGRWLACSKRGEVCGLQPFIGWQTWKMPCPLRRENTILVCPWKACIAQYISSCANLSLWKTAGEANL